MSDFRKDMKNVQCMIRDPLGRARIPVDKFVGFLKVKVSDKTVNCTGWTDRFGDNNLQIHGGIVSGVDCLSSIRYGRKLSNQYNDFVNPLYLKDILTDEGWQFFTEYYKYEVESICKKYRSEALILKAKAESLEGAADAAIAFIGK